MRQPDAVKKVLEERESKMTLALLDSLKPDEEILELYNVYISKNHFYHRGL